MYLQLTPAERTRLRLAMAEALRATSDPMTADAVIRRAVIETTLAMVSPGPADIMSDVVELAEALDVEIRMIKARTGMAYISLDLDALSQMHGVVAQV